MIPKKEMINIDVFQLKVNLQFEGAKEDVKKSNATVEQFKDLTVNLMDEISKKQDLEEMCAVTNAINKWKTDKTLSWKAALTEYGRACDDIVNIFVGENSEGSEIVIVADSVITQAVLEHNDYCFDLCDDNEDIDNFVVYDKEEFDCMKKEYTNYKKVYQRGV